LNPVIQGEETGQVFFRFENGATAIWDANRYNEVESPSPRYTFGQMRIDATGGHLTMDTESNLRVKPLGQPGLDLAVSTREHQFCWRLCLRLTAALRGLRAHRGAVRIQRRRLFEDHARSGRGL